MCKPCMSSLRKMTTACLDFLLLWLIDNKSKVHNSPDEKERTLRILGHNCEDFKLYQMCETKPSRKARPASIFNMGR